MKSKMSLPPAWYVIGEAAEFQVGRPNGIERFGLDLVIWRSHDGKWIAQVDRCPHRSARLSLGTLQGGCLTCPFHGFRFDASGTCTHAPEINGPAPGLRVTTFPVVEKHGFLWLAWENYSGDLPWFEDLSHSRFRFLTTRHQWQTHFSRCVENQLDHSHLPFVHDTTIGRSVDPALAPATTATAEEIRVDGLGDNAYFQFRFGNIWTLRISDLMRGFIAFVPVNESQTLIYMRHYQAFVRVPVLERFVCWLMSRFNKLVLAQDHDVVMSQRPINVLQAADEHLMPSDRAIREFRRWLKQAAM